jgi:hypothetical protein
MKANKVIIACKVFADELQFVLRDAEGVEVIWIDAALHADLPRLEQELTGALAALGEIKENVRVFLGVGCHPDLTELANKFGVPLTRVKNCLEAFLGNKVRELEQDRTMLMTPGWIRAWPGIMASMGWDEVDVRINLGRYQRILLLEPGINPLNDEEILTFFDLVQVPIEVEPLELHHFRSTVAELLDGPMPFRK